MASQTSQTHVPVLIIGGGIVGLSASLCLSHYGIQSLLIERRAEVSVHPRARSVNTRTMEIFRHLGIDDLVREAGASMMPTKGIYSGYSVKEIIGPKPTTEGSRTFPFAGITAKISPVRGAFVTQDMLEPVLVDTAKERIGEVRFSTECLGVEQDDESVKATLKDRKSGTTYTIRADYLLATDGAKSALRTQLNIPTSGSGTMGNLLNILFHADLKSFVQGREFSVCIIDRPEVCGLLTSINSSDRWVFHLSYDPSKGEQPESFPPEKCKELLRIALGMPDVEIDIKSTIPWEPSVMIAERMQQGRIFLAGDAAHQMPPWAGQGANSGVADAHNLAWKVAAVLKGQANAKLLETYQVERLPVGREAAEVSAAGVDERGFISVKFNWSVVKGFMRKIPIISGHGYGYSSKAICEEDTSPLGGVTWRPWTLPSLFLAIDGRPGRRVPHIWVEQKGKRVSTLDLCGKGFVLLAGADGRSWVDVAEEVSSSLGIDITAYCVGTEGDLVSPTGIFEAAVGISSRGAILVRPDNFVVWRGRRQSSNDQENLEQAMKTAMCL